jgi:hypothetical protein
MAQLPKLTGIAYTRSPARGSEFDRESYTVTHGGGAWRVSELEPHRSVQRTTIPVTTTPKTATTESINVSSV